jgi:hypothetical protein
VVISIEKNTEYPFHAENQPPTCPAQEFIWDDAERFRKSVKALMKIFVDRKPYDFTDPIGRYTRRSDF